MSSSSVSPLYRRSPSCSDLSRYSCFLFDCDGVLWEESTAIPGAHEILLHLSALQKKFFFLTNNSSKSRRQLLEKFLQLGFSKEILTIQQMINSGFATGKALKLESFYEKYQWTMIDWEKKSVFVVGDVGLGEELRALGLRTLEAREIVGNQPWTRKQLIDIKPDESIGAVVVGIDDQLTYAKVSYACAALRLPSKPLFLSTNQDSTLPTPGAVLPGGGSCVSMIATASERVPINIGKPEGFMLDFLIEEFSLDRRSIVMIGDRLDTDILFAVNGGIDSILVETGIHTEKDVLAPGNSIQPTFIVSSIRDLMNIK